MFGRTKELIDYRVLYVVGDRVSAVEVKCERETQDALNRSITPRVNVRAQGRA